ncbi:RNA polymerase sigma factor [Acrocarpospora catenulata]|uniref:RNA polymerase sigma factor n=1 Tax=Acrocarpospora catenulata TaxID=2836182 RepID=UPI001BDB0D12|nr:RNA polymerase sigma factor [Acrocarpospora catenulata]
MTSWDAHTAVDAVWKLESARIIAGLVRMVGDVGLAEEFAQDALLAALERWPEGVPDNPGAWLMAIAKRRAVDHLRRAERLDRGHERLAHELSVQPDPGVAEPDPADGLDDDVLRLMFVSCHPALSTRARAALTLRLVGGLRTEEIARAFLVSETAVAQRIVRAKRTLAARRIPFEVPPQGERAARLSSVLEVVYLVFNEGYAATAGDDLMRPGLCLEALRLGRLLARLMPGEAEVHGLVALMELQASRAGARTGPQGEPIPLHEQNRGRWDRLLIHRGMAALLQARAVGGPFGPYVLQAAIAVCHAQAATAEDTDWAQIAALYAALSRVLPTPVVRLNQAVAVAMADGPEAGLALIDPLLAEPAMRNYHLLPGVRGDLLARLGRSAEARAEFERAAALAQNGPERAILLKRAAVLPALPVTFGPAVAAFLDREGLDPATVRSYRKTLTRLLREVGADRALAEVTAGQIAETFAAVWGRAAAATWNRHRAAVRSFAAWAEAGELGALLERRPEPRGRSRPMDPAAVETLLARPGLALRERAFWTLLYEHAARAEWALALDVEDGGRLPWPPRTAALLAQLIGDRVRGPLFLADRRSPRTTRDRCPDTGRGRLSYERAEYLFKQASGCTLRQLSQAGTPPSPA